MTDTQLRAGPGRKIRQARSRKTYEALIAAGFRLLEKNEFEAITVARLAEEAGYSVGAFYARFKSKDQFFEAIVAQHLDDRATAQHRIIEKASHDELIGAWVANLVNYYWKRRAFWRAALLRSTSDPTFWEPINRNAVDFVKAFTARVESDLGRVLTKTESTNIRFAIHMVLSTVNNRIVNRPRPKLIGYTTFVKNLTRAFYLISDYDNLIDGEATARVTASKRRTK